MNFFEISFWQGFAGNLFATLIGVIVGIPIAFWINNQVETKTEQEKKAKILKLLSVELSSNRSLLIEWEEDRNSSSPKKMYGALLSDEVWNAFSDGGELQWIKNTELLSLLATSYGEIKRIKYLYESYLHWKALAGGPQGTIIQDLWSTISKTQALIERTNAMITRSYIK